MVFPKAVLCAPPPHRDNAIRSRTSRSTSRTVTERLSAWRRGDEEELWSQTLQRARNHERFLRKNRATASTQNTKRALKYCQEGNLRKATQALQSLGVHSITRDVISELESKHPQTRSKEPIPAELYEVLEQERTYAREHPVLAEEALRVIRKFPRAVAGGGSALTPAHLRDLTATEDTAEEGSLVLALAALLQKLLVEAHNPRVFEGIAGAPLTALVKEDLSVRPIAVGKTYRRILSSIMMDRYDKKDANSTKPVQMGVSVSSGIEAIAHGTRRLVAENGHKADRAIACIDFRNAFNCVDRNRMLAAVCRRAPHLRPWAVSCYGPAVAPWLWAGFHRLRSATGVQ